MSKKTVIVNHGNPNNPSWIEREFKRANEREASGGIVTGGCCIDDCTHTLVIMNKTSAMGKSEQMLNSWRYPWEQKVLPEHKSF